MSRIGYKTISLPQNVTLTEDSGQVQVKGPLGELTLKLAAGISLAQADNKISIKVTESQENGPALHGLMRSLVANMVKGVSEGFEQQLELIGAGYRAKLEGNKLTLALGFSHPVIIDQPEGLNFEVEGTNKIKIKGIDKQAVGQMAAKVRSMRPPEPYKGKGIRYEGEVVRRKAGKAAKAAGTTGGGA